MVGQQFGGGEIAKSRFFHGKKREKSRTIIDNDGYLSIAMFDYYRVDVWLLWGIIGVSKGCSKTRIARTKHDLWAGDVTFWYPSLTATSAISSCVFPRDFSDLYIAKGPVSMDSFTMRLPLISRPSHGISTPIPGKPCYPSLIKHGWKIHIQNGVWMGKPSN